MHGCDTPTGVELAAWCLAIERRFATLDLWVAAIAWTSLHHVIDRARQMNRPLQSSAPIASTSAMPSVN